MLIKHLGYLLLRLFKRELVADYVEFQAAALALFFAIRAFSRRRKSQS
jgi:hypothetical protein